MSKIVSHCWADANYETDGFVVSYKQLQVVAEDGKIWALLWYLKDKSDPLVTKEWVEVEIPLLPQQVSYKDRCKEFAYQLKEVLHEGWIEASQPRAQRIKETLEKNKEE